ncbi:MarR family transcriptional regulator [Sphingomonas oligophenolica]|uniref:MarR family winged helix-turn-helix transcriptional regulator n=1 Tax=Sphingomonas oligophenolica TaxID=301154 RepID=A0ABU9Y950_9SPHN
MAGKTKDDFRELHGAMVDLFALMSRPQRDDTVLRAAGITLDRALYPLLIGIGRFGPIGIVELSERVGRDYTTVSRQVTKLESLLLVERKPGAADRRVSEVIPTAKGRDLIETLDAARQRLAAPVLEHWPDADFKDLARLLRRFVDDLGKIPQGERGAAGDRDGNG